MVEDLLKWLAEMIVSQYIEERKTAIFRETKRSEAIECKPQIFSESSK
jgi:hypothetical protein